MHQWTLVDIVFCEQEQLARFSFLPPSNHEMCHGLRAENAAGRRVSFPLSVRPASLRFGNCAELRLEFNRRYSRLLPSQVACTTAVQERPADIIM